MLTRRILCLSRSGGQVNLNWEPVSISSCVNTQCVRWRKTRLDPPPKNKVIVKRRPVPNEWEDKFLKTRNNHYNTIMKGIMGIIRKEVEYAAARDELLLAKKEEEQRIPQILAWNEEENEKTRKQREMQLAEEAMKTEEEKLQRLLMEEQERVACLQQVEELVRMEKEASKSFITLENMEEKIEEAIANPKNYNFLLKQDGRVILPEDTAWKDLKELSKGSEDAGHEKNDAEQAGSGGRN